MALEFGFPSADGLTGHAAARRDFEGMVVRDSAGKMRAGVFYAHGNDLITRRPDMKLDIPDFRAVQDKGGACFIAGVGVTTTPTFAAAPAANKRIDLLYLTQELPTIDSTTEIIFGIVQGTASPTPVRPSLPAARADAIPWAAVEIPAGATSMQSAGVIITPLYPYTAMAGGTVAVRNSVELAAWAPGQGGSAHNIADKIGHVRGVGGWLRVPGSPIAYSEASTTGAINSIDMEAVSPQLSAGQRLEVVTSSVGSYAAASSSLAYALRFTTDGTPVTPVSPSLMLARHLVTSGGTVTSAPSISAEFVMPADGVFRVALNPAFSLYAEKRWLSVRAM